MWFSFSMTVVILGTCQLLSLQGVNIPHKRIIDLRSDTVTLPSLAMRTAIFNAEVGDDVYGEDPTVHKLEKKLSTMFNKEAALFFPSGTMSNLAATMSWCGSRGSEMIVGDSSHLFLYEQGGISQLAGIMPRTIANNRDGTINLESIEHAVRQNNIHFPVTELIALEDTHNFCGGRVLPKGYLEAVGSFAKSHDIKVHLDGARIWNAATASGTSLSDIVQDADSVSICLSKGLGAPSGSVLVGPKSFIEKARRCRKVLGGGMRQIGILAAAGLQAVADYESGILLPDHSKAKELANRITGISGFSVDIDTVDTNIVLVNVEGNRGEPHTVAAMLKERGILALPFGARNIRLVTHRDIIDEDLDIVISAFKDVSHKMWPALPSSSSTATLSSPLTFSTPLPEKGSENITSMIPEEGIKNEQIDERINKEKEEEKNENIKNLIKKVIENKEIFRSDLSRGEIDNIVDSAQKIVVQSGDLVIRKGDKAESFYIIETGRVNFYLEDDGEYAHIVKSLTDDSFFGEIALMYDAPRAATVIAFEETTLWRIHKKDFFSVLKSPDNKLGYFKVSF